MLCPAEQKKVEKKCQSDTNQLDLEVSSLKSRCNLSNDLLQSAAGSDTQARSAIAELPSQLDRVAACCAVYFFMQHPDEEALRQLQAAVTAMQELLQEARLALA